ncbi:hypothetical protein EDI_016540 [Entamoeba dispar SAW760]|uniref:Uncharacterized protein n=1 Tax=Entamoeba dispar (strain ATCC PRA-260 / SAW760) TaxID=370354 RepID=B0ENN5_ENTDS|nr:uncharacterized protein EDI_016540 [Entamoeba dispar SAW760]EDR23862.1 hypothetical protein EDI_016540 [Entamoeba dispar SAW760]|eukprot:EDR23862.1 hypothetical protein EDI_016540 [Entamoeba dispar SAW760]
MNLVSVEDMVCVVDKILDETNDSSFWEETIQSQVKEKDRKISIDSNISYLDEKENLVFIKTKGIIDINYQQLNNFMQGTIYYRLNPFVVKYNEIETTSQYSIFEVEYNIFGYNKVAFCCKKQSIIKNNKHYYFILNITDDRSNAIPFRDSQYLYRCFVFEQLSYGIKITDIFKIQPTPWCHPIDNLMGARRQTQVSIRFFKMLLDISGLMTEEIPLYIELERNGFEKILTQTLPGKEVYSNCNYKISEISRFKGDINFQCVGIFRKKTNLKMNIETMIRLVFQNRCQIIEKQDNYFLLKKGPSKYYDATPDTIIFSLFIYSDECSMFHYHSAPIERLNKSNSKMFFFNSAYVLLSKDINGYWNVQYFFDVSEKTTELSMEVIHTFLNNMENSIYSYSSLFNDTKEPFKYSTLQFELENKKSIEGTYFFVNLNHTILQKICLYLTENDIKNLKATNKHIKTIINYVFSSEDNPNNKCSKSLDDNLLVLNSKAIPVLPSLFNLVTTFNEPTDNKSTVLLSNKSICRLPLQKQSSLLPSINSLYSTTSEKDIHNQSSFQVLEGHSNVINSIDIHSNNVEFISGSSDRKLKVWDTTHQPITNKVFIGPNSSIVSSVYHNNFICVGYKCGTIKYIDTEDIHKSIIFDSLTGKINGFLPLQNNSFVVWNDTVEIINYFNFKQTIIYTYSNHLRKVTVVKQFIPSVYISGSVDRTVHIWDIRSHFPTIGEIKPHKSGVLQLGVIDSYHFCSIGNEKVLMVWDIRNLKSSSHYIENKVDAICCSNNQIICGCDDSTVKIYNSSYQLIKTLTCPLRGTNFTVISTKNNSLVAGSRNGNLFYVTGL